VETGAPGVKPPGRRRLQEWLLQWRLRGSLQSSIYICSFCFSRSIWFWSIYLVIKWLAFISPGEEILANLLDKDSPSPGERKKGAQYRSSPSPQHRDLLQPGLLCLRSIFFNQSSFFGRRTTRKRKVVDATAGSRREHSEVPPRHARHVTDWVRQKLWQWCGYYVQHWSGPWTGAHQTSAILLRSSATRSSLITIHLLQPVFFLRSASRPGPNSTPEPNSVVNPSALISRRIIKEGKEKRI